MTTMQMTVSRDRAGQRVAKLTPVTGNSVPRVTVTEEGSKPLFGTYDLVAIATKAKSVGYTLNSLQATDSQLHLLRADKQLAARKRLLDGWNASGADGVFEELDGPLRGRAIASIELLDQNNRFVRIGRNGDIDAADESTAKSLADLAVLAVG